MHSYPVVVVGAGQAGVAISRQLQVRGIEHVVLERGRVGETWRTQRWESFRVNTPNWCNGLPGLDFPGEPHHFPSAAELFGYLERYAAEFQLPIHQGVAVTAVDRLEDGFAVQTDHPDFAAVQTRAVVLASGSQNRPRVPAAAVQLPETIVQIHAGAYRNPAALPPRAVLVVGSAQSGCQIAEDLLAAGRRVYLSVSKVGRAPRRYRGRDILEWFLDTGFFGMRPADLPDPALQFVPQPQVSGVGEYGHTVSLQDLARQGVTLVGRFEGVDDGALAFDDSVAECVRFSDTGSAEIKQLIDGYLARQGSTPPPLEPDPADEPCVDPEALAGPGTIDAGSVGAVVWTTGFEGDFSWVHLPISDERGRAIHRDGIAPVPGVFFVGLPWLRTRSSGVLPGVGPDAIVIAAAVAEHLGG